MGSEHDAVAARIAAVAGRQHGVISFAQLCECGLPRATISRWAKAGHLHRLQRGTYAVGHRNVSREGAWLAAVLAAGPGAVVSHVTAARVHHLDRATATRPIHLSVPPGRKASPAGLIVHRPRQLDPIDVTRRRGIPATTVTRTLFDQAALLRPSALREQFERAEYLETLDRRRLNILLAAASGRRGLGYLRRLAGYRPLPLSQIRSQLEGVVLRTCRTYDLPLPEVNAPLLGYEVDFIWERARFVVEADGGLHKGEQRERDNARDLALQRAGYLVRRYGELALADEGAVAVEIRSILTERLAALS